MIETVTVLPHIQKRHREAPLLKERDQYLAHLLRKGYSHYRVRGDAAFLIHIIRVMKLTSMRKVELNEIIRAGKRWANYRGPLRRNGRYEITTSKNFVTVAKAWLNYYGCLVLPPAPTIPFSHEIAEYKTYLTSERKLSSRTIIHYVDRTRLFLQWISKRHNSLSSVSLIDIDNFVLIKKQAGWTVPTLATICMVLRSFFAL